MSTTTVSFEFTIRCEDCGEDLTCDFDAEGRINDWKRAPVLTVKPCEKCMGTAAADAHAEGRAEGREEAEKENPR